jgi:hypothetical protein
MVRATAHRSLLAAVLTALLASCSSPQFERNVSFRIEQNLPVIDAEIKGRHVGMVVASAMPSSVLSGRRAREIGIEQSRARTRVFFGNLAGSRISPLVLELDESIPADGMLGADAWQGRTLTIDYRRRVVILTPSGPIPEGYYSWSFKGPPKISVLLDGIVVPAIVDTAIPDTAIIPEALLDDTNGRRNTVDLEIAGVEFDDIDVTTAPTGDIRIGNRLLSNFLVQIDYDHRTVALWPDSR